MHFATFKHCIECAYFVELRFRYLGFLYGIYAKFTLMCGVMQRDALYNNIFILKKIVFLGVGTIRAETVYISNVCYVSIITSSWWNHNIFHFKFLFQLKRSRYDKEFYHIHTMRVSVVNVQFFFFKLKCEGGLLYPIIRYYMQLEYGVMFHWNAVAYSKPNDFILTGKINSTWQYEQCFQKFVEHVKQ